MRIFSLLFAILLLSACSAEKTVLKSAQKHISMLASEEFQGRGYTHGGLQMAENYIAGEMLRTGLIPVYPDFRQKVKISVNILEKAQCRINNAGKIFGTEFLVSPHSESKQISGETFHLPSELFDHTLNDQKEIFRLLALNKGKIPVLNYRETADSLKITLDAFTEYLNREKTLYDLPAVIHIKDELVHGLSAYQDNFTVIELKELPQADSHINCQITSKFEENYPSFNIVGKINGLKSDSAVIVTAHYDHLGKVNETVFYGANDNASGVSMLLNLAGFFKKNPPENDIYFYAMTGEEAGLQGAIAAAEDLPVALEKIKFLINVDIFGTGDDGIQVVNSIIFKEQFEILNNINVKGNLVKQIKTRGESCNSDHCPFYEKGIPSFFIYTLGGISHYHDPLDKAETLPLTDYYDIYRLLTQFIEQL